MYKIKSLILLLSSIFYFSCATAVFHTNTFKLGYIDGELDGLILKNLLSLSLKSYGLYDENSPYLINASISHNQSVFITNVNNTSDREKIITTVEIEIINTNENCEIYQSSDLVSQFYIISPNINFVSNKRAMEEIKQDNSEILVKKITKNILSLKQFECL